MDLKESNRFKNPQLVYSPIQKPFNCFASLLTQSYQHCGPDSEEGDCMAPVLELRTRPDRVTSRLMTIYSPWAGDGKVQYPHSVPGTNKTVQKLLHYPTKPESPNIPQNPPISHKIPQYPTKSPNAPSQSLKKVPIRCSSCKSWLDTIVDGGGHQTEGGGGWWQEEKKASQLVTCDMPFQQCVMWLCLPTMQCHMIPNTHHVMFTQCHMTSNVEFYLVT